METKIGEFACPKCGSKDTMRSEHQIWSRFTCLKCGYNAGDEWMLHDPELTGRKAIGALADYFDYIARQIVWWGEHYEMYGPDASPVFANDRIDDIREKLNEARQRIINPILDKRHADPIAPNSKS